MTADRGAIRQALSVSVATGLYGISFGALSVAAGLSIGQTMALSALMFSGGSQFAVIGVLGAGGSALAALSGAGLLGVRNGLYGPRLRQVLGVRGPGRVVAAQLTIDESTAVASAQTDLPAARTGFWWTGVGVYVIWNALTLVGALAGDAMGDPRIWGLDAAAAAAFLGLLWPRLRERPALVAALLAAAIAVVLIPVAPAGVPVLAAVGGAVIVGLARPGTQAPPPQPGDDEDKRAD
jgi:predicted branched-subunit amino acid permease